MTDRRHFTPNFSVKIQVNIQWHQTPAQSSNPFLNLRIPTTSFPSPPPAFHPSLQISFLPSALTALYIEWGIYFLIPIKMIQLLSLRGQRNINHQVLLLQEV